MLYQVGETSHIQERPVNSICSKKTDRFIPTVRPEKVWLIDIPALVWGRVVCGGPASGTVCRPQGL